MKTLFLVLALAPALGLAAPLAEAKGHHGHHGRHGHRHHGHWGPHARGDRHHHAGISWACSAKATAKCWPKNN